MGVFCSCFGESLPEHHQEDADTLRSSNTVLQNVVNKYKSIFRQGHVEVAATCNDAGAAAEATSIATTAPGAVAMQREVQARQRTTFLSNETSSRSGTRQIVPQGQNPNKAGSDVAPQRKSSDRQGPKPVAEEARVKKMADFSSEDFEDSVEKFSSSDEDDVCPTCLEEYDEENPKIMTQCNHHYHLACIYEWMERSSSCPVCGELMVFQQMN